MVKAPSSHGLDRKFKPWRRGKSQNSNKRSSLKQQLRGHERLLTKTTDDAHKQSLQQKIEELKQEIANKQVAERERKNAKQSHGSRFLERQKLVRMEHNAQKEQDSEQLDRIALDQVYVGHFPLNTKYLCLFRNGQRRTDPAKVLSQRARTRHRILFQQLVSAEHKDWISSEQYSRVERITKELSSWTVQEERKYFGQEEDVVSKDVVQKDDSRFTVAPQHEAVLAAAQQIEKQLDTEDPVDSSNEDTDSASSDSDIDPLKPKEMRSEHEGASNAISPPLIVQKDFDKDEVDNADHDDDDSSTTSSSSSSDNSSTAQEENLNQGSPRDETNKGTGTTTSEAADEDSGDDFLVEVDDKRSSSENAFSKAQQSVEPFVAFRGDKSKGWTTQKQRPGQWQAQNERAGQFKKRRFNGKNK